MSKGEDCPLEYLVSASEDVEEEAGELDINAGAYDYSELMNETRYNHVS